MRTWNAAAALLVYVVPAAAQYSGPAILTRGGTGLGLRNSGAPVTFRPSITLMGIYDSGLTGPVVDPQGNYPNESAFGGRAEVGVEGYHKWRHTSLDLSYRGDYQHYTRNSYYDGLNQFLALNVSHQATRRVQVGWQTAAGLFSRNYGFFGGYSYFDPLYSTLPANEVFDNRTSYLSSMANVTYQKSVRTSFNFAGQGFTVRRRSNALYGVTGAAAMADVAYRVSRHTTVGAGYMFYHYEFNHSFGTSDLHTVQLFFSRALTRTWQFNVAAGGIRVESSLLRLVHVDPEIAALLGQATVVQAAHFTNYFPMLQARLMRQMPRSTFEIGYMRWVVPGNGVFTTSQSETASAHYSYAATRNWWMSTNFAYSKMSALAGIRGRYTSYTGGASATRRLGRSLHGVLRWEIREYDTRSVNYFSRTMHRASIGIAFAPGDFPLSFW